MGATIKGIKYFGKQIKPTLLDDGVLVYPEFTDAYYQNDFEGYFISNDSVYFKCRSGGLGGARFQIVNGKKIIN